MEKESNLNATCFVNETHSIVSQIEVLFADLKYEVHLGRSNMIFFTQNAYMNFVW